MVSGQRLEESKSKQAKRYVDLERFPASEPIGARTKHLSPFPGGIETAY